MITNRLQASLASFALFLFFGIAASSFADSMKIAVAATGSEKTAAISEQAGRAPFFLFFDESGHFLEAIKNPAQDMLGGAGRTTASFLAEKGATSIIAGNIGDKMEQALLDFHVEFKEKTGVAHDVVQAIIQNH